MGIVDDRNFVVVFREVCGYQWFFEEVGCDDDFVEFFGVCVVV